MSDHSMSTDRGIGSTAKVHNAAGSNQEAAAAAYSTAQYGSGTRARRYSRVGGQRGGGGAAYEGRQMEELMAEHE